MRLTHFGHSCLLVESADARVLIDPGGFSERFEDVRDLDAVLVTHQHADHCDVDRLPGLLAANPGARLLAEPQIAAQLRERGHDLAQLASGQQEQIGELVLMPVGRRHAVIHDDIPRIDNLGVVLRAEGEPTLFHPGDALDADPGPVDLLCTPINAPWCALKETIEFVRRIGAPTMIPIHDALLHERGRELYLRQIHTLGSQQVQGLQVRDLAGAGEVSVTA